MNYTELQVRLLLDKIEQKEKLSSTEIREEIKNNRKSNLVSCAISFVIIIILMLYIFGIILYFCFCLINNSGRSYVSDFLRSMILGAALMSFFILLKLSIGIIGVFIENINANLILNKEYRHILKRRKNEFQNF